MYVCNLNHSFKLSLICLSGGRLAQLESNLIHQLSSLALLILSNSCSFYNLMLYCIEIILDNYFASSFLMFVESFLFLYAIKETFTLHADICMHFFFGNSIYKNQAHLSLVGWGTILSHWPCSWSRSWCQYRAVFLPWHCSSCSSMSVCQRTLSCYIFLFILLYL